MARVLMFQGTGSDVGKSLLVAGLCRFLANRGENVRPFKPQNMSNNAAVATDGGEIGRAQALQARAARIAPVSDMNPVLLKPQSGGKAQIVVRGHVTGTATARDYQRLKKDLLPTVLESFDRLKAEADWVLVEGAGSASEINLRAHDIANMGFARAAGVPVVIIGDIDRGGVIAQLVGTKAVLDPADAALIKGFIVNKMRGDATLFAEGMTLIAEGTGWPALGLVPYFDQATSLPAEDSLALRAAVWERGQGSVRIVVPLLPFISNFDDLDPFRLEPAVSLHLVRPGDPLPPCDLVILPGSKSTIADLHALRDAGWNIDLKAHVRRGGYVVGLCGGYQMLGKQISDPDGREGPPGTTPGLGLLDVETRLTAHKQLREIKGKTLSDGIEFAGYEMHLGVTERGNQARPAIQFDDGQFDGATSPDGRVMGCYIHGLFAKDRQRQTWIARLGGAASLTDYEGKIEATLDALAAHLERHLDIPALLKAAL